MIPGVTVAGHTGRLVIEPITSTDDAAAMWLRSRDRPGDCVWLTAHQLRLLSVLAAERADWLTENAPFAARLAVVPDPPLAPPAPSWRARALAWLRTTPTPTGDPA